MNSQYNTICQVKKSNEKAVLANAKVVLAIGEPQAIGGAVLTIGEAFKIIRSVQVI